MTDIKIGYMDKHNGEPRGFVLRINDRGFIQLFDPKTNEGMVFPYWLEHYEEGSAVFLGVDEDDI